MTKADLEFKCLCIYQWLGERSQNILDKATFVEADLKKSDKHREKLEGHCKPRGSKLVAATQYRVLTQGDMGRYISLTPGSWTTPMDLVHGLP